MNAALKTEIVRMFKSGVSLCDIAKRLEVSKGTLFHIKKRLTAAKAEPVRSAKRHKCPCCGHSIVTETCLACSLTPTPVTFEERLGEPVKIEVRLHGEERKRYKALKAAIREQGNEFDLAEYLKGEI